MAIYGVILTLLAMIFSVCTFCRFYTRICQQIEINHYSDLEAASYTETEISSENSLN